MLQTLLLSGFVPSMYCRLVYPKTDSVLGGKCLPDWPLVGLISLRNLNFALIPSFSYTKTSNVRGWFIRTLLLRTWLNVNGHTLILVLENIADVSITRIPFLILLLRILNEAELFGRWLGPASIVLANYFECRTRGHANRVKQCAGPLTYTWLILYL